MELKIATVPRVLLTGAIGQGDRLQHALVADPAHPLELWHCILQHE